MRAPRSSRRRNSRSRDAAIGEACADRAGCGGRAPAVAGPVTRVTRPVAGPVDGPAGPIPAAGATRPVGPVPAAARSDAATGPRDRPRDMRPTPATCDAGTAHAAAARMPPPPMPPARIRPATAAAAAAHPPRRRTTPAQIPPRAQRSQCASLSASKPPWVWSGSRCSARRGHVARCARLGASLKRALRALWLAPLRPANGLHLRPWNRTQGIIPNASRPSAAPATHSECSAAGRTPCSAPRPGRDAAARNWGTESAPWAAAARRAPAQGTA